MSHASVKTVQYVDPRIEPQPDPVYDYVIAPTQNQYYRINASGLSDTNITFNNLTTLGVDRAYLDTFEIELTVEIDFVSKKPPSGRDIAANEVIPRPDEWTFQSFPFNTCCDEARVNINGGAFFSQPLCYVRAKERYMNEWELAKCYSNVCPVHKPICQQESGRMDINDVVDITEANNLYKYHKFPTRYGQASNGYSQSSTNLYGGYNNQIIDIKTIKIFNDDEGDHHNVYTVTWREPLFVSPFSSRYDATYGRPLYNITSMDFAFNLSNLGRMIRTMNLHSTFEYNAGASTYPDPYLDSYSIKIKAANLCYQVMTIPSTLQKPLTTLVPYRRFVPYITQYPSNITPSLEPYKFTEGVTIKSGVYTLNEIPTGIWVFCAPTKNIYQTNTVDNKPEITSVDNVNMRGCYDTNNLFAFMTHLNISMANTTQILNTAQIVDLYRIAKANGCEDSYYSWTWNNCYSQCFPYDNGVCTADELRYNYVGAGSVLRLKPGVDIIIPDQALIPGANANNMVLQVEATFNIPPHPADKNTYALWLLFEYVGVAAISPGQCEITMNPLGDGKIVSVSPIMSATSSATEGALEGFGFWDGVKRAARIAGQIADDGVLSRILKHIPGAGGVAKWAESHGFGEPCGKRARGGAVLGKGLSDWV